MTQVIFTYDEEQRKWQPYVMGENNETDARDAFHAVVATCHMIVPSLQEHAKVKKLEDTLYEITPAM